MAVMALAGISAQTLSRTRRRAVVKREVLNADFQNAVHGRRIHRCWCCRKLRYLFDHHSRKKKHGADRQQDQGGGVSCSQFSRIAVLRGNVKDVKR